MRRSKSWFICTVSSAAVLWLSPAFAENGNEPQFDERQCAPDVSGCFRLIDRGDGLADDGEIGSHPSRIRKPTNVRLPESVRIEGSRAAMSTHGRWVGIVGAKHTWLCSQRKDADPCLPFDGHAVDQTTLLFFSDDAHFFYIVPLVGDATVLDLMEKKPAPIDAEHAGFIEQKSLTKSRTLLLARDDRFKQIGLLWALQLGDTAFIATIATYAETSTNRPVRELARRIMEAYRINHERRVDGAGGPPSK
jgi:hypothetical protein